MSDILGQQYLTIEPVMAVPIGNILGKIDDMNPLMSSTELNGSFMDETIERSGSLFSQVGIMQLISTLFFFSF